MVRTKGHREDLTPVPADILSSKSLSKRLECLGGMAWAYTVLARLDITRYKANLMFAPKEYASGKTSSKFNQYIQGIRSPKQLTTVSAAYDIVREVGYVMNSSEAKDWLNHPLWRIFKRTVGSDELATYLSPNDANRDADADSSDMDERKPFRASGALLLAQFPPSDLSLIKGTKDEPRIEAFSDFVHLCAMFRLSMKAGYWHGHWQLIYLSEQAANMNDVFRFIRAPFVQLLQDYYDMPSCFNKVKGETNAIA